MFDQIFNLDHSFKLYVPSTVKADAEADTDKVQDAINLVIKRFSGWFGGATANDAVGGWYSDELDKVITEKVTIITSFADASAVEAHAADVLELARWIKTEFSQEAVSLEYDGKLFLI